MSLSQSETGLTKQKAADFMGVSVRQLERYVEKGMPRIGVGVKARFIPESFAWHRQYEAGLNAPAREADELSKEQARKTMIEANRAELKLLAEQGKLVPIEWVRNKQEKANYIIREKLLGLPTKMAPVVMGLKKISQVKAKLETEVHEVLEELRAEGKR